MNAVLLAAGYGTRLRPLTDRLAKPLLPVGGRPLLDYTFAKVRALPSLARCALITNARDAGQLARWAAAHPEVELVDDGSTTEHERPGAVGDLALALERLGGGDDVIALGCDNLFSFSLEHMVALFERVRTPVIAVGRLADPRRLAKSGVVVLADDNHVLRFDEKPARPRSDLAAAPIYVLPAKALPRVAEYLDGGGNPDAPGHFMEWLCAREAVHAFRFEGPRLTVDTPEEYASLCARWDELEGRFTFR